MLPTPRQRSSQPSLPCHARRSPTGRSGGRQPGGVLCGEQVSKPDPAQLKCLIVERTLEAERKFIPKYTGRGALDGIKIEPIDLHAAEAFGAQRREQIAAALEYMKRER